MNAHFARPASFPWNGVDPCATCGEAIGLNCVGAFRHVNELTYAERIKAARYQRPRAARGERPMTVQTEVVTVVQPEPEGHVTYPKVAFTRSPDEGTLSIEPVGYDRYSTNLSRDDARELAYALLDYAEDAPVITHGRHVAFPGATR